MSPCHNRNQNIYLQNKALYIRLNIIKNIENIFFSSTTQYNLFSPKKFLFFSLSQIINLYYTLTTQLFFYFPHISTLFIFYIHFTPIITFFFQFTFIFHLFAN